MTHSRAVNEIARDYTRPFADRKQSAAQLNICSNAPRIEIAAAVSLAWYRSRMSKAPSPIRFGINFLPHRARELLDCVKAAEDTGFDIAGVADSQSLYRDVYVCEALVATHTKSIRFGARVINPLTRHPAVAACAAATLEELAPGRTMLGIGTGDSAGDNIGLRPAALADMSDYVRTIRELLRTGQSQFKGAPCK